MLILKMLLFAATTHSFFQHIHPHSPTELSLQHYASTHMDLLKGTYANRTEPTHRAEGGFML